MRLRIALLVLALNATALVGLGALVSGTSDSLAMREQGPKVACKMTIRVHKKSHAETMGPVEEAESALELGLADEPAPAPWLLLILTLGSAYVFSMFVGFSASLRCGERP